MDNTDSFLYSSVQPAFAADEKSSIEGIENIYLLLDNGRLKEALTQLQAITTQNAPWELRNRVESTLMSYGYMLQYAAKGMNDPNRHNFYRQTLRNL